SDAAAAAGGKRGYSSLPGSRRCSAAQNALRGDCTCSSACLPACLANPFLHSDRFVLRSFPLRAVRDLTWPGIVSDSEAGSSADRKFGEGRCTERDCADDNAGSTSRGAGRQTVLQFL